MNLLIMGPPGAGKGTIAGMISKRKNILHISTGDLFREEAAKDTAIGKKAKEIMERGQLMPDEITTQLLKNKLKQASKGFILDGFPRTLPQAHALENITKIDKVLNLTASKSTVIKRLSARRTCKKCNAIYNLITVPPKKEGICDKCGSELYQRDDDKPAAIEKRHDIYIKQTEPLIKFYKDKNLIIDIDAEQALDKIFQDCLDIIEKL